MAKYLIPRGFFGLRTNEEDAAIAPDILLQWSLRYDKITAMNKNIISVRNASFDYKSGKERTVGVLDISVDIPRGQLLAVVGRNGSGKSTFAKLLNRFLLPDEGKVFVDGKDTADDGEIYAVRSKVGMVFQNPDNQMVASIIEDDIAFGPENLGVPREEIIRRVAWALETVGMEKYRDRTPLKLSGGQKQRVAIAAILAMLPEVLVLDESTAMLDPDGRREVLDTVKKLNKENGTTVILITHYMDEAIEADRILVMNEGQIIADGAPEKVFSDYAVIEKSKLELPVSTWVAKILSEKGFAISPCLTDEELTEEICRLK